jgi:hypothetical protein
VAEADLVLKFEIDPDRDPLAESVAHALDAWVDVLKASAAVVDPESALVVELVGVEPGSQVFKFALRKLEAQAQRIKAGGDEYPLLSKTAIALGGLVVGSMVAVGAENLWGRDLRLPADQMAVFNSISDNLAKSVQLQQENARFWGILQDEPAFKGVEAQRGYDRSRIFEVPRDEFATRSGIWSGDDEQILALTETRTAVWDVVLIKPVLVPEERRWTFARDGIEFSALMTDKAVLSAIHDRTLPLQMAEGVGMKIEVTYRERFDGTMWIPVPGSRRVKRVLYPRPSLSAESTPLFSPSRRP